MGLMRSLRITLEMIKFEHTIFALPFAFLGAFLAAGGAPPAGVSFWILAAMVGARSAAMAFNRLADRGYDALNPRTQMRALPRGLVTARYVKLFVAASSFLFIFAAAQLNRLCLALSPVALGLILFYSYSKRFTWTTHFFLGLSLACAPVGGWVAVRGELSPLPLWVGAAVALWVAGFDIIYACQDVDFDQKVGLYSLPRLIGIGPALAVSALLHLGTVLLLFYVVSAGGLGFLSYLGAATSALLLAYEHIIVKPDDLSRIDTAFFTVNGSISVLLFAALALDLMLRSGG